MKEVLHGTTAGTTMALADSMWNTSAPRPTTPSTTFLGIDMQWWKARCLSSKMDMTEGVRLSPPERRQQGICSDGWPIEQ